jgi:short-subunit dehydrogenase
VLAKKGVRVVVGARDMKKAMKVREKIQQESPNAEVILLEIDLSSLASVKRFCSDFLALDLPLNILM